MNVTQARAEFTKQLIDVYQEAPETTNFLRTFFPTTTSPTKYIAIEVERSGEPVAIDVIRGTEGNRNRFSLSTEKNFEPPFYREYFDATQLDLYNRVLGSQGNANAPLFAALLNDVSGKLKKLQNKIERSKERQCAQVLISGVVTLAQGTDIDYKRKSASIVDLTSAGGYWAANSECFDQIEAGCNFLRKTGKSGDGVFNLICGSTALADLLKNTKFQARQNLFNMALDAVQGPARDNNTGATFHGIISCGSYKVQLWAYPQFYDDPSTSTPTPIPYIDNKYAVLIPMKPRFHMAHAAVPQLIGEPGQEPKQGEYVFGEFRDERNAAHIMDIMSAAVALPVSVDTIYTMKAVTG